MRFRVLGPVTAQTADGPLPLGPARQRAVLAVLLLEPGTVVPVDQLVARVWGLDAPERARTTLYSYLSRLRRILSDAGGPELARVSGGYVLTVAESAVDLHRFRALVAEARRVAEPDRAAALWNEAMALWQGRAFADVNSEWLRQVAAGLERERLAAVRDRVDVRLRRGEHAGLVPELVAAAAADPLDERVAGQLMVALYRGGRQADALAQYRSIRDRLVDELGSDPGPELRELHARILRQDPDLGVEPSGPDRPPGAGIPAQLPAGAAGFTGRDADLRRLDELLRDGDGRAVLITAIGGTAGVGKTALAVHWAHRVVDRFPDGQLYVNLRGYDPEQPMDPGDALAGFLTALSVTGQDIPLELDERAARFRSEVAGRRMLIVLDNAGTAAQLRPLLPGTGSCAVLVTSRDSLAGLVAVDGAHRVDLDVLSEPEAVGLLRRLVGDRVAAEPEAATALAGHCARLPLALRVAAELAVSRPDSRLGDLVAELADRQARLELLDAGDDPRAAVREVFSWSIQHLPGETVRLFRLLGLHPGPDFDPYAAAALAGTGPDQARRTLAELARAHLVHRSGRDRYGMHDLLHAYAAELAGDPADPAQRAAEAKLFDYYLVAAAAAMDTLHPAEAHYRPKVLTLGAPTVDLTDPLVARAWLDAELPCLIAISAHVATHDSSGAVDMARILQRHLDDVKPTDLIMISGHALRAAERAGDAIAAAHALCLLGRAHNRLGRYEEAVAYAEPALAGFRAANDPVGEGMTLNVLGFISFRQGDHKEFIDIARQAVAAFRRGGDRFGEATALNNIGIAEGQLGRHAEAADNYRRALTIFRAIGARYGEGNTLNNLANLELRRGNHDAAGAHLRRSLAVLTELGSELAVAHTLDTLGILHLRLGQPEPAAGQFQEALACYRRTGDRNGQAWSTNGLGEAAQLAGRPADAIGHHTEALALATATKSRQQQARANAGLGHACRALGDLARARASYEAAYAIYRGLGLREAEEVRHHLDALRAADLGEIQPDSPVSSLNYS